MRVVGFFAFAIVFGVFPLSDAFGQSPRAEASRYDTRMCHLVYKVLRTGRVVHDPYAEPESYIEMLKSAAQAGNEKYPGRRYSVVCARDARAPANRNARTGVHTSVQTATGNGAMCGIVTMDDGPSIRNLPTVPLGRKRALEAQLPALRAKYRGRSLDVACEGGE